MTELERWTQIACHGLDVAWAGAIGGSGGRKPFPLPGDQAVWGRDRPFRVDHLRLDLSFEPDRRVVEGRATTTLHPRHDGLSEVTLDAVELDVQSVTDAGGRELEWRTGDRTLRIDLGREYVADEAVTVTVAYRATPRRGLYFNAPEDAYPGRPSQIWTQGQPQDSPCYFPCFDFPGEKFTTEAFISVDATWYALSNGSLVEVIEDREAGRRTFHWSQERPHPAYLVTVAAGEFDVVEEDADGVPAIYLGPPGSREDLVRAFGRTPEMIRFFSDRIGVPYPWAKYATVAIADFIFGGMENTSATTMTDILLHDERAHEDFVETADSITAHELAHQWFGDLLTCREWSHGWLNESFATYFDALFVEHHRGWDAFRYDLHQKAQQYHQEDSSNYRRPLVENVYRDPIDIFDRHLYERGSVVLDMLRTELGNDLWWTAIRHYVETHQESDVLTHDFQRAIEEATGRNMDAFFAQWVWKAGHPELKASCSWDGKQQTATVSIEQTQKADDRLTSIYRLPLEIGFLVDGVFQRRTVRVSEAHHSFVFSFSSEPEFVSIDPAGRVLKTLEFTPGEAQLKARLQHDPEVIGRIDAAHGLAKVGSPSAIEALRAALLSPEEQDFVRAEVASALGKVKAAAARDVLIEAAGEPSARVRRAVVTALGEFRDDVAAEALQRLLADEGDPSYYVQAAAATALGKTREAPAYEVLTGILGRTAHNDAITAGALSGLGAARDTRAIEPLLGHTQWGVHQNARRAAVGALAEIYPFSEEPDRTRIRERLEELLDDRWLRVQLSAVAALESIGDPKSVAALRRIAGSALDGRLARQCRVTASRISERADKGEEVRSLKTEVEELRQANQKLSDRLVALEARVDQ